MTTASSVDHPDSSACTRVLIAETNADIRAIYRTLFHTNWNVIEADEGRDALAKALVRVPNLVITDLRLPFIDGWSLCDILRRDRTTKLIPLIVTANAGEHDEVARVRRLGVEDVLIKPVDPARLLGRVDQLLNTNNARPAAVPRPQRTVREREQLRATVPLRAAPVLVCPQCNRSLLHESSHVGGIRCEEQWDYFKCSVCGHFEYRHRTRKTRLV